MPRSATAGFQNKGQQRVARPDPLPRLSGFAKALHIADIRVTNWVMWIFSQERTMLLAVTLSTRLRSVFSIARARSLARKSPASSPT